ncbi:hypothetical protein RSOLAG1IB_09706 [Rhizoctonia solani AG-1 IB]|uniref:Uncharacterized protein n=1 Tax=Thanatephorus cucumeris (strain AG1-IB / isolate 7/3/14) TaxID=1108050 RepID=A0A0B7FUH9_THACB|nr:hypothetical protein RSOLAG1IB_09706 [Rhizoctonia solani AG-1 IB]
MATLSSRDDRAAPESSARRRSIEARRTEPNKQKAACFQDDSRGKRAPCEKMLKVSIVTRQGQGHLSPVYIRTSD